MLCVRPGCRPHLFYRLRICRGRAGEPKGFTSEDFVRLLTAARHQLDGPLVVVWDNLPAHHSRATRRFIDTHTDWLTMAHLPAYAPELNPVEAVWAHLKTGALANLAVTTVEDLIQIIRTVLKRAQYRPALLRGFLAATGLQLEPP